MTDRFKKQVHLLISVIETVLDDRRYALNGSTAINLFYRDLPRYSVDIDLCYLPLEDRATSMTNMHTILQKIAAKIKKSPDLNVVSLHPLDGKKEAKLQVIDAEVKIKIEPNYVLRGHLFPTRNVPISDKAGKEFNTDIHARCLSFGDVYGGKSVAIHACKQFPRALVIWF